MGTDPNRNFDFQWATVGSSDQPCSDTFHGSGPFSEAETRNVRDFVMPRRDQLKHFIDVHSYSQIVITPWGYTSEVPDDWDEVGNLMMRQVEVQLLFLSVLKELSENNTFLACQCCQKIAPDDSSGAYE